MKILVCVKRVIDYNVKVRVKADGSGVETSNVKMSMNPFDEIAVEEAIRLKEQNIAKEVIVVSIGSDECLEILSHALALGADSAILVNEEKYLEPINIAKILKAIVEQENPDVVILGKQAIDDDANQTGQMLAALLIWPQATYASKIEMANGYAQVTREVDAGLEIIKVLLPAVITTDLRLNEPRYASLPNIMKAKQKPIKNISTADLNLELQTHTNVVSVAPPSERKAGIKVPNIEELLDKLKNQDKVLP